MTATSVPTAAAPVTTEEAPVRRSGEVSLLVTADPQALYHRVADVTRAPEWSPEVRRVEWLGGATAAAGARFRGRSRSRGMSWWRECEVLAAEPGVRFAWRTVPLAEADDSTVWEFRFAPAPGGTLVTHAWEIVRPLTGWRLRAALALAPQHRDRGPDLARSLERLAAAAEGRADVPQLELGQAHTARGPIDLRAMWVMHHAFRRDLRDVARAVPATPVGDAAAWSALHRYWTGFADALHHHHRVEDLYIWPPLLDRTDAAGDAAARDTLAAMEAEHGLIDPALDAVEAGLRAMATAPDAAARDRLAADVARTRDLLAEHLAHEETGALPLVQRYLSEQTWADGERAASKEYGTKGLAFTVPWVAHGLPPEAVAAAFAGGGPVVPLLHALFRRGFRRLHGTAFRHLPAG